MSSLQSVSHNIANSHIAFNDMQQLSQFEGNLPKCVYVHKLHCKEFRELEISSHLQLECNTIVCDGASNDDVGYMMNRFNIPNVSEIHVCSVCPITWALELCRRYGDVCSIKFDLVQMHITEKLNPKDSLKKLSILRKSRVCEFQIDIPLLIAFQIPTESKQSLYEYLFNRIPKLAEYVSITVDWAQMKYKSLDEFKEVIDKCENNQYNIDNIIRAINRPE